jgi:hypothetical protein
MKRKITIGISIVFVLTMMLAVFSTDEDVGRRFLILRGYRVDLTVGMETGKLGNSELMVPELTVMKDYLPDPLIMFSHRDVTIARYWTDKGQVAVFIVGGRVVDYSEVLFGRFMPNSGGSWISTWEFFLESLSSRYGFVILTGLGLLVMGLVHLEQRLSVGLGNYIYRRLWRYGIVLAGISVVTFILSRQHITAELGALTWTLLG